MYIDDGINSYLDSNIHLPLPVSHTGLRLMGHPRRRPSIIASLIGALDSFEETLGARELPLPRQVCSASV